MYPWPTFCLLTNFATLFFLVLLTSNEDASAFYNSYVENDGIATSNINFSINPTNLSDVTSVT